jgi:hypothetical protein
MKSKVILSVIISIFACSSFVYSDVPKMINYQGKLTTPQGALIDTTVPIQFSVYATPGAITPLWTEIQDPVDVENGSYSVLLGSVNPIPYNVFDGTVKYLGIKVGTDSEMTPRQEIVSVPYAYRAATVQSGGFDCSDCDDRFVNVNGPDSVVSDSGTTFWGKATGSSASEIHGIRGNSENSSTGRAYGGRFSGSSEEGLAYGVYGYASGSSSASAYGSYGNAANWSTGHAYGGYFYVPDYGTGTHVGVSAYGRGNSSSATYGAWCSALSLSTGPAYGGYFNVSYQGTGTHYGLMAEADANSDTTTYGCYGYASNSSTGDVYGGYFSVPSSGSGEHYGVWADALSNSSSATYGCYSYAENTSVGNAYGVKAYGVGSTFGGIYGCYGTGENTSTGGAMGGYFYAMDSGTGSHTGVAGYAGGNSSSSTMGSYGYARNDGTGTVYGGYFYAASNGSGTKYGVWASAPTNEGWAGYFSGDVRITDSLVVLGGKSAAVKVDNGEYRLLYSQESPEAWFEDFGQGQLVDGKAVIQIDPLFAQTVNTSVKYHVFLTPHEEPLTLAVANKTVTSFEVIASADANISFSYRIVAKRKGYEDIRLAQMGGPTPEQVAAEQAKHLVELEQERARMEEEKQKMEKDSHKIGQEHKRMEERRLRTEKEIQQELR